MDILESNKNFKYDIKVSNVTDPVAKTEFECHYGGNYFISVSTITPNAVPSSLINYKAPELPPPHQVKVFNTPEGHYKVDWHKPILPPKMNLL